MDFLNFRKDFVMISLKINRKKLKSIIDDGIEKYNIEKKSGNFGFVNLKESDFILKEIEMYIAFDQREEVKKEFVDLYH